MLLPPISNGVFESTPITEHDIITLQWKRLGLPKFRLATTVAGICVIALWKLVKFHVTDSHPYSALTIWSLANILASKSLVYNGLQDHAVPT